MVQENGQFGFPSGVALDSSGNVFVVDRGNDRIQKFTQYRYFYQNMGHPCSGNGQFYSPVGVAVDSSGNVFVTDYLNYRVQKFTNTWGFY